MIIKMDVGVVRNLATRFRNSANQIENSLIAIRQNVHSVPWQSQAREEFIQQLELLHNSTLRSAKILSLMGMAADQKVSQWEELSQGFGKIRQFFFSVWNQLKSMLGWDWSHVKYAFGNVHFPAVPLFINPSKTISDFGDVIKDFFRDPFKFKSAINMIEFSRWWNRLTENQKKEYIIKEQRQIAKELGIEIVSLEFTDLSIYNYSGVYSPNSEWIGIEEKLLKTSKPWELINTLAHEMRHRYQHEAINHYENTGKPPKDVSLETIEKWKEEFQHPIKMDEEFEEYRKQKIEVDARRYGYEYAEKTILEKSWKQFNDGI